MEAEKKTFSILIADDHEIVRHGLKTILELEPDFDVVGEAASGEVAVAMVEELSPDLVVMDLKMPGIGGVEATRRIKGSCPNTKVLILTAFEDDQEMFDAIEVGVSGFLLKDMEQGELIATIRTIMEGQAVLDPAVTEKVFSRLSSLSKFDRIKQDSHLLTDREVDVLKLMARGFRNQDIANALWVSEGTIKTHVSNILRKLNQSDRAQAVIAAFQLGIIEPKDIEPVAAETEGHIQPPTGKQKS